MAFTRTDLAGVARLARLSLTNAEMDRFLNDLDRIVNFVTQLNEVNVDGVAPMSHAGDRALPLRDDVVGTTLGRESLMGSAGYEEGLIRVPKVIE